MVELLVEVEGPPPFTEFTLYDLRRVLLLLLSRNDPIADTYRLIRSDITPASDPPFTILRMKVWA